MGNRWSNTKEAVQEREEVRTQNVQVNRTRLQQTAQSTQLMTSKDAEKTRALMGAMDFQLQRGGKTFTKADLVGILLYVSVLKNQPLMQTLQESRVKTCDDLRVQIRGEIYSSPETLQALRYMSNPALLPVATYAGASAPAAYAVQPPPQRRVEDYK